MEELKHQTPRGHIDQKVSSYCSRINLREMRKEVDVSKLKIIDQHEEVKRKGGRKIQEKQ